MAPKEKTPPVPPVEKRGHLIKNTQKRGKFKGRKVFQLANPQKWKGEGPKYKKKTPGDLGN